MAVFDELLNDINNRFNLNGKASTLLANLLTVITDRQTGSLAGFLELFHRARLGNVAETWVSSGANTALSRQQLEDALGNQTLDQIANRSGLSKALAASALAYMIPLTVDALTPNSALPDARSLSASVKPHLSGEKFVATNPTSKQNTTSVTDSEGTILKDNQVSADVQNNRDQNSVLRLLLPLLLVGLLAFLSFRFCNSPNRQVVFPNANKPSNSSVDTINNSTTNVNTHR